MLIGLLIALNVLLVLQAREMEARQLRSRPPVDVTPVDRYPGIWIHAPTAPPPESVNQRDAAPGRF